MLGNQAVSKSVNGKYGFAGLSRFQLRDGVRIILQHPHDRQLQLFRRRTIDALFQSFDAGLSIQAANGSTKAELKRSAQMALRHLGY